jgi:septum site-determining protein MinD
MARVIGVVSAKGGVGKTTTVANVGVALAGEFGQSVLALDLSMAVATLGLHFGIAYPPAALQDVLNDRASPEKVTYIHESGLRIIPASFSIEQIDNLHFLLKKKVEELAGDYDIILIDSAPGLGEDVLAVMQCSNELLVVTNPEFSAMAAATKVLEVAKSLKIHVIGIVLNRVSQKNYELSEKEVADVAGFPVVASVPEDENVPKSIGAGVPVVLHSPRSGSAKRFKELAAYLVGVKTKPGLGTGMRTFLKNMFAGKKQEKMDWKQKSKIMHLELQLAREKELKTKPKKDKPNPFS